MTRRVSIEHLGALIQVRTKEELAHCTALLVRRLGFDHFLVGVQVSHPFAPPRQHITNGYPVEWRLRYDRMNYITVDPTVQHCLAKHTPLLWSENIFCGKARPLWDEARAHGLLAGLSLPVRDRLGTVSMLSVARDQQLDVRGCELAKLISKLQVLACCTHHAISHIVVPELLKGWAPKLTPRELECLKWAAAGKTAWETAHILNISERTAVFHLTNLVRKLGVINRTQAIVVGVSLCLV